MKDSYYNLANAIVQQAVKDYRKALRTLSLHPYYSPAQGECGNIEQFFRSDWFCLLTRVDPETLIRRLSEEVAR